MTFGAPMFLIGFAALVVPIIIHLWSKNTRSSLAFGSIRFLKETETRTMQSIMPSQWLLLLLRLLLLAILVLILASPMIKSGEGVAVNTRYLIDPEYAGNPVIAQLRDTLAENDEMRWLADGFPEFSEKVPVHSVSYWTLLSQQQKSGAKETVVISPLNAKHFWGAKQSFPIDYQWVQLPTDPETKKGIQFVSRGKFYQLNSTFSSDRTTHDWEPIEKAEPISISYAMRVADEYKAYESITKAALSTLNELSPISFIEVPIEEAEWIFWFANQPAPGVQKSVTIDRDQVTPWMNLTSNRVSLSSDWTKELAVQEQFAKRLLTLIGSNVEFETSDLLSMNPAVFTYELGEEKVGASAFIDASHWLWVLLLIVLLTERYVAFNTDRK
jgi:hypothetical protein